MGWYPAAGIAQENGLLEQGQVQLTLSSFGIGGLAREGDWAGIQVEMLDTGSSSRDIVLRMTIRDEDGDETQYDRVVTANPGVLQSFWLYSWIPFRGSNLDYELKAYAAIDTGNTAVGEYGFRVGRLLGQLPILNSQVQPSSIALGAVVGSNQMSLNQYGFANSSSGHYAMIYGHELIRTSPGLEIQNLPDRWQGLTSLDMLVWSTAGTASTSPARLSPEKARAIRTWVERGGHLVIVLPSSGDPWYVANHPLRNILPNIASPKRQEGVNLELYRPLLTESADVSLPSNAVVHTFQALDDAQPSEAIKVLNGPDDQCVVIRRIFGAGMVSVVGLPLNNGQLRRVGLPDPEAFWHRVLGLRGEVVRPDLITDQQKSVTSDRTALSFDQGLSGAIAKTGRAVQGVFFGIVVFVVYWLVGGPLGYALLKVRNKKQHAWVAFIATTAVFTALAWIGATTMRPKSSDIQHLTLLEQVYGQDTQRTRSWLSVMLPSYGTAVVSLDNPEDRGNFVLEETGNLLTPWSSPESIGTLTTGFPDNSGYRVDSKNPSAIKVPTRATVKSFRADWAGPERWLMPRPVSEPGSTQEPKLTISGMVIEGQISHDLPGALTDVQFFVLGGEVPIQRVGLELGSRMISRAAVFSRIGGGWEPGTVINMSDITKIANNANEGRRLGEFFISAFSFGVNSSSIKNPSGTLTDRLIRGRFISQLQPPRFDAATTDPVGTKLAQRRMLHGWDLGKWFTQPTLIVTGILEVDSDDANPDGMPTPIWINDRKVPTSGKTLISWIYPFDANPPEFIGRPTQITEPDSDSNSDMSPNDDKQSGSQP
jgi:hypothetical protein